MIKCQKEWEECTINHNFPSQINLKFSFPLFKFIFTNSAIKDSFGRYLRNSMIWSLKHKKTMILFEISLFFVSTQAYPETRDRKDRRGTLVKKVNDISIFLPRANISYNSELSIYRIDWSVKLGSLQEINSILFVLRSTGIARHQRFIWWSRPSGGTR